VRSSWAWLALVVLAGCEEPVPATPSFATDVRPIFEAHCVRCHGAGGTLNVDPRSEEVAQPASYLGQYDDVVDCTPDAAGNAPPTCVGGARYEAEIGNIKPFIHGEVDPRMPPPPSDPLSRWELAVIDNWLAETPPQP
jgi:hypothetical protein